MGNDISLKFFGSPRIEDAGSIVEMDTRKATALRAFSTSNGLWHYFQKSGKRMIILGLDANGMVT